MAEVLFYRLTRSTLAGMLPVMVERSLARGARVAIRGGSEAGLAQIDDQLWRHGDGSFLPHGLAGAPHEADQPVLLTTGAPVNGAGVLLLVDGARVDPAEAEAFDRVALIFDGTDAVANDVAREDWKAVAASAHTATYWAEEDGRWVEKAKSG
ncbi:MAG: DNA polymerase III subunit chi [Pseudomonadota bacterium]